MAKEIVCWPNPILNQPSQRLSFMNSDLLQEMVAAAQAWEAEREREITVGLAAVQIGEPWRLIIIRNKFSSESPAEFRPLLNPKIVKSYSSETTEYEGCLSVPGCYAKISRSDDIKFEAEFFTGHKVGQKFRGRLTGFAARVLQHEIDHLKGRTIVDRARQQSREFATLTDDGQFQPMSPEEIAKRGLLD